MQEHAMHDNGAQALSLTLEDLFTNSRVQIPVMRQYKADTWYDQNSRIVFTSSKGLVGVGLPCRTRPADLKEGTHCSIESPSAPSLHKIMASPSAGKRLRRCSICDVNYFGRLATIKMAGWVG